MAYQAGDVVQLKSGGPKMTVEKTTGVKMVHCVWFDKDGNEKKGQYNEDTLKEYDPDDDPTVAGASFAE